MPMRSCTNDGTDKLTAVALRIVMSIAVDTSVNTHL
jgi:hypothetical protein